MKWYIIALLCFLGLGGALAYVGKQRYGSDTEAKEFFVKILAQADVQIDGSRPWDITVNNPKLYQRILQEGSLGLGESYMDGWWDCKDLDVFFFKVLRAELDKKLARNWSDLVNALMIRLFNYQTKERALEVGKKHYDISNEFFKAMLDKRMIYSCAYWKNAKTLDEAQEHKLDLICRKLGLKKGMTLLDIGCGWGGLALFAAKNYGVEVTGVTISKEQFEYAEAHKGSLPVTFSMKDYRDCEKLYDRIVSVGMFEHVGTKNYAEYMSVVSKCLKDDGLALIHTIGSNISNYTPDPWINKYIFANGILPSLVQVTKSAEGLFVIEDIHSFGADYDKTLMAWNDNFEKAWPRFKDEYGDRFYRMWRYYLLSCAGSFRARGIQLWQFVLSKKGVLRGYESLR